MDQEPMKELIRSKARNHPMTGKLVQVDRTGERFTVDFVAKSNRFGLLAFPVGIDDRAVAVSMLTIVRD